MQNKCLTRKIKNFFFFQKNGFFIECGAFDGEQLSNTLLLEIRYGWTGLLIEMDPHFYTQLRGKNRKAYSINACLSPTGRVSLVNTSITIFIESVHSTNAGHLFGAKYHLSRPSNDVCLFANCTDPMSDNRI